MSASSQKGVRAKDVKCSEGSLIVELEDGRTITAPLDWFPRLLHGSTDARARWNLSGHGEGIHWPELDEDISVPALLEGKRSGESARSLKLNLLQQRSFDFALQIVQFSKRLVDQQEYLFSKQILRRGTSLGSAIEEAVARRSAENMLPKLKSALKGAFESKYWLRLISESKIPKIHTDELDIDLSEVIRLLTSVIKMAEVEGGDSETTED
jgi:four helix bundle protein